MGLNYSYVLFLEGSSEKKIWAYLGEQETLGNVQEGTCLVLPFELDAPISEYIKNLIRNDRRFYEWGSIQLTEEKYPQYIVGSKGKIGCLYVHSYKSNKTRGSFFTFTAATTNISILVQDSTAIEEWFVEAAKEVGAIACFLDLEEQGYRLVYPEKSKLLTEELVLKGEEPIHQLLRAYIQVVYGEEYLSL